MIFKHAVKIFWLVHSLTFNPIRVEHKDMKLRDQGILWNQLIRRVDQLAVDGHAVGVTLPGVDVAFRQRNFVDLLIQVLWYFVYKTLNS